MMIFHVWNERLILPRKRFPPQKKCSLEEQNCVKLICFYLRCYGTIGLPCPFVFYPLFAFGFRFFDTDLPIPIRFSVIEV